MDVITHAAAAVQPGDAVVTWPRTMQFAVILGIIAVTLIMLVATRRKLRAAQHAARGAPRARTRARYAELEQRAAVRDDVRDVMVELEHVAREIHGQLDTKLAKLEAVIRAADTRIAELTRRVDTPGTAPRLDVTVADAPPPEPVESPPEPVESQRGSVGARPGGSDVDDAHGHTADVAGPERAPAAPGSGQPAAEAPATRQPDTAPPDAPYRDATAPSSPAARHADVYRLADSGVAPGEIAKRLGKPVGEVDLVLALRSARAVTESAGGTRNVPGREEPSRSAHGRACVRRHEGTEAPHERETTGSPRGQTPASHADRAAASGHDGSPRAVPGRGVNDQAPGGGRGPVAARSTTAGSRGATGVTGTQPVGHGTRGTAYRVARSQRPQNRPAVPERRAGDLRARVRPGHRLPAPVRPVLCLPATIRPVYRLAAPARPRNRGWMRWTAGHATAVRRARMLDSPDSSLAVWPLPMF